MRVLGIDPGTVVTGFGVIDGVGDKVSYVASGTVRTTPKASLPDRLKRIYEGLSLVIVSHQPSAAAVESIFQAHNVQSALKLGHARGVALLSLTNAGLPIAEYSPSEVRKAVVGVGGADKEQLRRTVAMLLGRHLEGSLDASDALAIAVCHYYTQRLASRLKFREVIP